MLVDRAREELYDFFNKSIVPELVVNNTLNNELTTKIETMFNIKFPLKYKIIVKKYEDTIRISANYKSLGIIFFVAYTPKDKERYSLFKEPTYHWKDV